MLQYFVTEEKETENGGEGLLVNASPCSVDTAPHLLRPRTRKLMGFPLVERSHQLPP